MAKKRKIPLRKCIVTKEMKTKEELIRIVRNKEGVISVDPSGKSNGRGAYLSKKISVIDQAEIDHVLNAQFKTKIDESIFDELRLVVEEQVNEK